MDDDDVCAAWEAGIHMVALNFQYWEGAMQLNRARFALNGNRGYVLQAPPPVLPKSAGGGKGAASADQVKSGAGKGMASGDATADEAWPPEGLAPPEKLRLVVLAADHLPKRDYERCKREPWDEVEVPELAAQPNEFESETPLTAGDVLTPVVEVDVVGGLVSACSLNLTKAQEKQWALAMRRYSATSDPDPG
eukprot:580111-Prymnesium_polylepis.1